MTTRIPNAACPWVSVIELADSQWPRYVAEVQYDDPDHSGGLTQIHVTVMDEHDKPISGSWVYIVWPNVATPDGVTDWTTHPDGSINPFIMGANAIVRLPNGVGPYCTYVRATDGTPTERVQGMGLPENRHVNYWVTFRKRLTKDTEPPPPPPPPPPPDDNPDLAELTAKVNALVAWADSLDKRLATIEANQIAQGGINGDVGRALAELQAFEAQIRAL